MVLLFSTRKIAFLSAFVIAAVTCCHTYADVHVISCNVPDDEEDPYVILCGEADRAIADEDYETAILRLKDAISIRPGNQSNLLLKSNLAVIYSTLGRDSTALHILDDALAEAPKMPTLLEARGMTLLRLGRDKEALADFENLIKIDSLNTTARFYHGMISLYSGNREDAENDFSILSSVAPDTHDTAIALSTLYSLTQRNREAIPYLEKLIETDPAAEYFATLAGCYLALDNLSEAGATISRGLSLYPKDPELYYYRAWLNRERFLLDEAKEDGKTAIKLGASPARIKALFR